MPQSVQKCFFLTNYKNYFLTNLILSGEYGVKKIVVTYETQEQAQR